MSHPTSSSAQRLPLLSGPIGPTLLRMAFPMVLGMVSIILFNLVDAYFVGQLGKYQLASMGYIFPFSFVVMSFLMGIGVGIASVLSRIIGRGDQGQAMQMANHALCLGLAVGFFLTGAGLLLMRPVFSLLGADTVLLPYILDYFTIWLLGVGLLALPMSGNSILRAYGNTRAPGLIMAVAAVANMILDPLFIFGIGPFPRMEMKGAALATVLSWGITCALSLWLVIQREQMVKLSRPRLSSMIESWKRILFIGLPAAGTNLLVPFTTGILTRIVSRYGHSAVAGFAVGGRVESLSMIGAMAVASVMTPFVGQNWGAGKKERAQKSARFSSIASLLWGTGAYLLLMLIAQPLAYGFTDDPEIQRHLISFLWIVPIGFGCYGISMIAGSVFNALHRPLLSTLLILVRLFVFSLPLAILGSTIGGLKGLFIGIAMAHILSGLLSFSLITWYLARNEPLPTEEEETVVADLPDGWE